MSSIGIISCPGGKYFGNEIIKSLSKKVDKKIEIDCRFVKFANGEMKVEINECIREKDIFIIQDVENHQTIDGSVYSVNDHIISLITTIDAVNHSSANSITVIVPTFPYSRQHRKKAREGLTASLLCHILESLKVCRVVTLDIHSRETQQAFSTCIMENLHASYQIIKELTKITSTDNITVTSVDMGSIERNKYFAAELKRPLAMLYKERDYSVVSVDAENNNIKDIKLLGDIKGKDILICDDMLDTGGSLLGSIKKLKQEGANKIIVGISLPFFNGKAIEIYDRAYSEKLFDRIIGTNAVYQTELWNREWFIKADIAPFFAEVINRLHNKSSLSALLDSRQVIQEFLS
jgi:ribose-phosphate pyrophosphokinase